MMTLNLIKEIQLPLERKTGSFTALRRSTIFDQRLHEFQNHINTFKIWHFQCLFKMHDKIL
jgi:hypothetical protein